MALVIFPETGRVECNRCQDIWCDHLKLALVQGLDSELIWNKPENSQYIDAWTLQIPVFPEHHFWESVSLEIVEDAAIPMYEVRWPIEGTGSRTLCYITRGEGRNVIRTTLIERMFGDLERRKECEAKHHGYKAQVMWERHMDKRNKMRYIEAWSVYTTGQCLTCADTTLDDAVPNKEGSGVWNTGGIVR